MKFYTVPELEGMLKRSQSQLDALIESGKMRCHRFTTAKTGGIRVSQEQRDAYLRETESGGRGARGRGAADARPVPRRLPGAGRETAERGAEALTFAIAPARRARCP